MIKFCDDTHDAADDDGGSYDDNNEDDDDENYWYDADYGGNDDDHDEDDWDDDDNDNKWTWTRYKPFPSVLLFLALHFQPLSKLPPAGLLGLEFFVNKIQTSFL